MCVCVLVTGHTVVSPIRFGYNAKLHTSTFLLVVFVVCVAVVAATEAGFHLFHHLPLFSVFSSSSRPCRTRRDETRKRRRHANKP